MLTVRRAEERGHAQHGWLDSHHTFSFADYYDPRHMGFSTLRVINDDRVAPGRGFGVHSHRNMEIVSYVLEGALEHRDSMGTAGIIRPGDVQRMSAGTGVTHSELNASSEEPVHFLQIWLMPRANGQRPGYEQKNFESADKRGVLRLIASEDGRDGSLTIHSDVSLYAGTFEDGQAADLQLAPERKAWIHVAQGRVRLNGQELRAGDGAALVDERRLHVEGVAGDNGEVLVFDLA